MQVIGIAGAKRAGKDSIANILVQDFGFASIAPGDLIREVLSKVTGISIDTLSHPDTKENYRREQQDLGVEIRRVSGDPNFWIQATVRRALDQGVKRLVIPSIRGEEEYLRALTTFRAVKFEPRVWFVTRPGLRSDDNDAHEIEQFAARARPETYDAHIVNDGTLDDLRAAVAREMSR